LRLALLLLLVAAPAFAADAPDTTAVGEIRSTAVTAAPLAQSKLGQAFLRATAALPHVDTRVVWVDSARTRSWTDAEASALADTTKARLIRRELDESFYYNTRYGSPLAYLRPLELLAGRGVASVEGKRIMDFGYGTIGHLRLLASLGADVVGVEVDPMLRALYAGDQGLVPAAEQGKAGRLALVDGQWPATEAVRAAAGGGFDVILSKNTLKRGYIHPERPVNPRMLVHLGVDDSTYVAALRDALKPGGYVLIYNLSPAPSKPDQPYLPWSDGRCPFDRGLIERSGFEVLAYDLDDGTAARALGHALGWDAGPRPMDLANDLFAHATLLRKR
jgi:hypothetical protein